MSRHNRADSIATVITSLFSPKLWGAVVMLLMLQAAITYWQVTLLLIFCGVVIFIIVKLTKSNCDVDSVSDLRDFERDIAPSSNEPRSWGLSRCSPPSGSLFAEFSTEIPEAASDRAPAYEKSAFCKILESPIEKNNSVGRVAIFQYSNKLEASAAFVEMKNHFLSRYIRDPKVVVEGIGCKCLVNEYRGTSKLYITSLIQDAELVINIIFPATGEYVKYLKHFMIDLRREEMGGDASSSRTLNEYNQSSQLTSK